VPFGAADVVHVLVCQALREEIMTGKTLPITGSCLCGAVRFEATEPPTWVAHCHCRMCQKAYGQPSGIFVGFRGANGGSPRVPKY
jgi:hypothetical protein